MELDEFYYLTIESKIVEWDEVSNIEQLWEQVKQAITDSARRLYAL